MSKLTLISCDYLHVLLNRCKEMHSLHRQRQCIEWDSNGLCLRCCIDDTSTRKESHLLMYICWNSSASYKDEQLYISFMLSWNRSNAREYRSCGMKMHRHAFRFGDDGRNVNCKYFIAALY
ncbi:unnamed protein product [Albugo candida]|uniref:Uncharacterized protein n=1 Tax=Albugo candida TaxID=65357 RepID=A0A024G182_9STRA|nr:unnamed protein product [Albugo candida]|eukprot:CCI40080.1 unnamed protein product [Albugo candida]